jgi:hypothetical protein
MMEEQDTAACQRFFEVLQRISTIRSVKLYRVKLAAPLPVPTLPCLDHEAMLHEGIPPHAAAYVEDLQTGGLHEVVVVPRRHRIELDIVSTDEEHSVTSRDRMIATLKEQFPDYKVSLHGPSFLRGDRRVMKACRAQISLRDVLYSDDFETLAASLDRLRTIGSLMEKESRVASWGVRTVTGPLLGAAAVVIYSLLGTLAPHLGEGWSRTLQYGVVTLLGAIFLYYGLKAVHLTEMANRVWKRAAEYGLILAERRRLTAGGDT